MVNKIFNSPLLLLSTGVIAVTLFAIPPAFSQSPSVTPSGKTAAQRAEIQREIVRQKLKMSHNPGSAASYRSRLAKLYLQIGEPEKAVTLYRYGIIIEPARASRYHSQIGNIYTGMGRDDLAEAEYNLADTKRKPRPAARLNDQIEKWEEEGRNDLLLQQYLFLFWTEPESRSVYVRKIARLLVERGEEEKADHYFRHLIRNYRKQAEAKPDRRLNYTLWIAEIYEVMGDAASAEEEYDRAIEIEGSSGGKALLEKATFVRNRGEVDRALELYQRAEEREGVDPVRLRLKIADLLEDKGDIPGMLLWMKKAAAVGDDESTGIKLDIARAYERHDQPEDALALYRETLGDLDLRERARVMEKIGRILAGLDREEEAGRAYRKALDLWLEDLGEEVADEDLLERLVELAEKAGEEEKAGEYYEELLIVYRDRMEEEPERAVYYHRQLGDLYRQLERYDEAASHYRVWSRISPSDPDPHHRLYRLYRDYFEDRDTADIYRARYRELRERNLAPKALTLKNKNVEEE
jgi:tetratricopeptide (TPR) repeat protein